MSQFKCLVVVFIEARTDSLFGNSMVWLFLRQSCLEDSTASFWINSAYLGIAMTDAQENLVFPLALFSFIPLLLPDAQRMTVTSEFKGEGYKKQAWQWEVPVP